MRAMYSRLPCHTGLVLISDPNKEIPHALHVSQVRREICIASDSERKVGLNTKENGKYKIEKEIEQ
jgi:hypothetical protein